MPNTVVSAVTSGVGGIVNPPKENDQVNITINGGRIIGSTATTIKRSMNTIADGFTFNIPHKWNNKGAKYTDSFTWYESKLYINDQLYISGIVEKVKSNSEENSTLKTIEVRTKAGIILDCPPMSGKTNYKNQTLKQIADDVLSEFNLTCNFPNGDSGVLIDVKRNESETAGSFLARLAKDNGFIINSDRPVINAPHVLDAVKSVLPSSASDTTTKRTVYDVIFEQANINGKPILELEQGKAPLLKCDCEADNTKRYSLFQCNSQTRGKPNNTVEIEDTTVPIYRPCVVSSENIEQGSLEDSAKWKRSRTLAEAAPVTVRISGWRDKDDKILLENNIVTLYYPDCDIFKKTRYLIESVSFTQGQDGKEAELQLVLPWAYTKEYPTEDELPWIRPKITSFDGFLENVRSLGGTLG